MVRITAHIVLALFALTSASPAADYDGNGYEDLAVSAVGSTVDGFLSAGRIFVLYGSANADIEHQVFDETSFGNAVHPEDSEGFGFALTSGDFDGDGFDDLAVSAVGERVGGVTLAGAVFVLYGSANRLKSKGLQVWHQNSKGIQDKVEPVDSSVTYSLEMFGQALAAGDFDDDGYDDLAIGVMEDLGKHNQKPSAGAVHVLRGGKKGLTATKSRRFHQDQPGIPGEAAAQDSFGVALLAADLNGDGVDDLAIGAFFDNNNQGSVTVLRGKAGKGLVRKNARVLDEAALGGTLPAPDDSERFFGFALAAGDFRGDGRLELAIGSKQTPVGAELAAGAVYVARLSGKSFDLESAQIWTRATAGVDGDPLADARFGASLVAGDWNGDGHDDLAIGAPEDSLPGVSKCGSVTLLLGSSSGLTAVDDLLLHQDIAGMQEVAESDDYFGFSLAAGDYNADGQEDLIVGAPTESLSSAPWAGGVHVLGGDPLTLLDFTISGWIDLGSGLFPDVEPEPYGAMGYSMH